jgi:putative heme transporter
LTVACAAARAVGTIPLMPGGLLVVEAVLVPGLVSSGLPLSGAISAMLIYRLISWLLLAAVGWVMFFFMFRTENEVDPDALDPDNESGAMPVDPADAAQQGPVPPDPVAETGEASASRDRRGAAQN